MTVEVPTNHATGQWWLAAYPHDRFDEGIELCDAEGMVRGAGYRCTGHAHWQGLHILCTSPAHLT